LDVDGPPISHFDRWTLEQLEAARREGVPAAEAVSQAVHAAEAGNIAAAGAGLIAALEDTEDIRLLFLGFQFFFRTGDHANAERMTVRRLAVAEREGETAHVARACTNLGLIHLTTGRLDSARALMERAVTIDERLNNPEGLARDVGNLANVFEATGDLDTAESLNRRSLEIATRIGAGEIAAGKLANLGDIAHARGRVVEARDLWSQAVLEFERLGIEKWRRVYVEKLRGIGTGETPLA
jgi:tetratricopeptide (TPR) repeat protein